MILYIYAENPSLRNLIQEHLKKHRWTDSGFDIPMLEGVWDASANAKYNHGIRLGIKVAVVGIGGTPTASLLLPRSSIGSSSFRVANCIGLIDQGYRGELQAKVDVVNSTYYSWDNGTRLFQLCRRDFMPWQDVILVDREEDLPPGLDDRGEGGFGSTGN